MTIKIFLIELSLAFILGLVAGVIVKVVLGAPDWVIIPFCLLIGFNVSSIVKKLIPSLYKETKK